MQYNSGIRDEGTNLIYRDNHGFMKFGINITIRLPDADDVVVTYKPLIKIRGGKLKMEMPNQSIFKKMDADYPFNKNTETQIYSFFHSNLIKDLDGFSSWFCSE